MRTKQYETKLLGADEGIVECLVAAFGNVDRVGDRVVKGAFADTLAAWQARGDPVPFIWSHNWNNPDAHIGKAVEIQERDDGLYVKAQIDLDQPFANQVYRLLKERRVRSFSFAYDVIEEKRQNGANELLKLDLLEIGPTLVPANEQTALLTVKDGSIFTAAALQHLHDELIGMGAKCATDQGPPPADTSQERKGRTEADRIVAELVSLELDTL